MARVPVLALLPPIIFAALAGLFMSGMYRSDPDVLPSTLIGQPAPPVEIAQLGTGPVFDDAALRAPGAKIVNFWASWCAPCRVEHAQLMTLESEGLTILGVNYKDNPAKALAFLDELGNPYAAIGADSTGRMALNWGVYGMPETFVIDGEGKILLRFPGPVTRSILENRIRPALAEASGAK
jgi:cytochrome c biogenesis protein CcmG, thiol:disulfide interchange protein DsbE